MQKKDTQQIISEVLNFQVTTSILIMFLIWYG